MELTIFFGVELKSVGGKQLALHWLSIVSVPEKLRHTFSFFLDKKKSGHTHIEQTHVQAKWSTEHFHNIYGKCSII